jgi:adenylate cyclase
MTTARRLAAILAADVVGYSRLMEADEAATLAALKAHRAEFIDPLISEHGGRLVKLMGDGALVEFSSVVDAVGCAVAVQRGMTKRNAAVPEARRVVFRIGVNLGDVIIEGDDIYGDGVNVAARLEALAEPGGICVSGTVHEHIAGKLDHAFTDDGKQTVKNILRPVQIWRWSDSASALAAVSVKSGDLPLPDKPSIAVLPFNNMSGDPEQEYFSDGITEDIITELSRFKNLFVIARNSSFTFKGEAVDVKEVGRKLGVAYVVEGSVRKAGNRVRVTAQLIEAESGNHIWAERYDRDLEDIFALQDELVHEIATAVPKQLNLVETQSARRRPVENLTAYDLLLRGEWVLNQEDFGSRRARALFERAVEIDPQCARAYIRLAAFHAYSVFAHGVRGDEAVQLARSLAEKALEIDPTDPAVYGFAASAYILSGEHDLARRHIEKAIKLNPNDYFVMMNAGIVLSYLGIHEKSLEWIQEFLRRDPFSTELIREIQFDIHYMARRYDDAIAVFLGWRNPSVHMYAELAAAHAQIGQSDDARAALETYVLGLPEGYDIAAVCRAHARMCARQEDHDHWLEGYRKAGLDV